MDSLDAFLRLRFAAGQARWLRDALQPAVDTTVHAIDPPSHDPPSAVALLAADSQEWRRNGAPADAQALAHSESAHDYVRRVRTWLDGDRHRRVLGWADLDYPSLLRDAPNPPTALFVEGQIERLWWPQIAIVGSRAPTPAGRDRAGRWARAFADAGFVVTSGLAAGIDAAAHQACLEAPGTIAVTGTGPDHCFPAAHRGLQAQIAHSAAVVTEHAPGTSARPEHFPSRNRIIAGLSLATVVIEAAHRSGSLITARLAAEAGREVFAIPGAPENLKARGCHRLIREGAVLVDEPEQVLEALGAGVAQVSNRLRRAVQQKALDHGDLFCDLVTPLQQPDGGPEALVANALHEASRGFDELLTRTGLTSATLAPILLSMELDGRLTQQHGVYLPCRSAPHTRAERQRRR